LTHEPSPIPAAHDYRAVGVLVMDAAYMVAVPYFRPGTPHLRIHPMFLFSDDEFEKPNRFTPDVAVAIDDVMEKNLAALETLESQFYEGGCGGGSHLVPDPSDPAAVAARKRQARQEYLDYPYCSPVQTAHRLREALSRYCGPERAGKVKYAEAFEICEYGRKPKPDEIKPLFPFFGT
jgi:hypothetical protein